jgi:hypothetical protein
MVLCVVGLIGKYIGSTSVLLCFGGLVAHLLETRYGLGRHISTVSVEDLSIFLKVRHVGYALRGS